MTSTLSLSTESSRRNIQRRLPKTNIYIQGLSFLTNADYIKFTDINDTLNCAEKVCHDFSTCSDSPTMTFDVDKIVLVSVYSILNDWLN